MANANSFNLYVVIPPTDENRSGGGSILKSAKGPSVKIYSAFFLADSQISFVFQTLKQSVSL